MRADRSPVQSSAVVSGRVSPCGLNAVLLSQMLSPIKSTREFVMIAPN